MFNSVPLLAGGPPALEHGRIYLLPAGAMTCMGHTCAEQLTALHVRHCSSNLHISCSVLDLPVVTLVANVPRQEGHAHAYAFDPL
jgi:hypothetical protein